MADNDLDLGLIDLKQISITRSHSAGYNELSNWEIDVEFTIPWRKSQVISEQASFDLEI